MKTPILDRLKMESKERRVQYIDEKLKLSIYSSNILSAVERFVSLDKGDRETLLNDIETEMEEINHFFQDITREYDQRP